MMIFSLSFIAFEVVFGQLFRIFRIYLSHDVIVAVVDSGCCDIVSVFGFDIENSISFSLDSYFVAFQGFAQVEDE